MKMSKIETAVRTVLKFTEAFNQHDVARMMQLLSDDCLFESTGPAPDGMAYTGKKAITQYWQEFFHESPQARIEIEEIFGLGFRCIMRWRYEWVIATGQTDYVRGVDIFKLKNGLICEKLSYVKG